MSVSSSNTALIPHPSVSGSGATRTLTYTPVANTSGTATITVTATDNGTPNANFSRTFDITVNPVNDSPTITLTSPNGGETWFGGSSHDITWNASDVDNESNTLIINLFYTTNGTDFTSIVTGLSNSSTYTWNPVASLDSSTVKIKATATDLDSPIGTDLSDANFTIDSTAPILREVTPVTSPTNNTSPEYTFNSSEAGTLNVAGERDNCSTSNIGAEAGNNTITLDLADDGVYNDCTVSVTDAAGNTGTLTISTFTIDTEQPNTEELNLTVEPIYNSHYVKEAVTVSANVTDNVGVTSVNFRIYDYDNGTEEDDPSCTDVQAPWSCQIDTTSLSEDPNYDIEVKATDTAGNVSFGYYVGEGSNYIYVDNTKPTNVTVADSGIKTANPNLTFTWPAVEEDGSGISFYQFWLSTATGVDFAGNVANTNISSWSDGITYDVGTIIIKKDSIPDDAQDFAFTRSFGTNFSLDDDTDNTLSNTATFSTVESGSYTVTENEVGGWSLTGLSCQDPDNGSSINLTERTATIDLDAGETITCTFTNTKLGSISGMKFEDMNGNGVKEASDSGRLGWTVNLSGEASASATTSNSGNYN
ncbi:hypothetical protein HYW42_02075 [Candidatus Daviesbacteria bacterium]|nr:hypothetical protein [Candidatus Daviesbacteria bacterium]